MPKNIIICSDGTNNKGGVGHETNVWRIFNGVDLKSSKPKQITFYDDGVGTEKNKILKTITAALGLGFARNLKQAYRFLCLNYQPGDQIYLFGFSRGAYTVRALAGFVTTCGVIRSARSLRDADLMKEIDRIALKYKQSQRNKTKVGFSDENVSKPVPIAFVGVWDTVSAIGFPVDLKMSPFIEKMNSFRFKDNQLSELVLRGCHALAIDDQRVSFTPQKWKGDDRIEQVWFPGMHSDVGGGYPKPGLAYVTLRWMVSKAAYQNGKGIVFHPNFLNEVQAKADCHGKMHHSRAGVAALYRYKPRDMSSDGHDEVFIHQSVFERMDRRSESFHAGSYWPGNLPVHKKIRVVPNSPKNTAWASALEAVIARRREGYAKLPDPARSIIEIRRVLQFAFLFYFLSLVTAVFGFLVSIPYLAPGLGSLLILIIMLNLPSRRCLAPGCCALSVMWFLNLSPPTWLTWKIQIPDGVTKLLHVGLPEFLANAILHYSTLYLPIMGICALLPVAGLIIRRCCEQECRRIFERVGRKIVP